jgi:high-affinity iron transporter
MFPSFLVTFREVLEAALIVATIAGILTKIGATHKLRIIALGCIAACVLSVVLVIGGSGFGFEFRKIYSGRTEEIIEGVLMILTAACITWAVFVINRNFRHEKVMLHQRIDTAVSRADDRGLFILVFTSVFREGFEIVLFLTTISLSATPEQVAGGFVYGALLGLWFAYGIFRSSIKLPIYQTFRITNILLIFFASGLLARGIHEFAEAGLLPEIAKQTFVFIPHASTFIGGFLKSMFGITRQMDVIQLAVYATYAWVMFWYVFAKKAAQNAKQA